MRIIEKHRKDLEPRKIIKYIYKCHNCGSILEVDNDDIKLQSEWGDVEEHFICPVCGHKRIVFGIKWHHLKSFRKLFNKKYR